MEICTQKDQIFEKDNKFSIAYFSCHQQKCYSLTASTVGQRFQNGMIETKSEASG